mgnify:CR=1 FL=1
MRMTVGSAGNTAVPLSGDIDRYTFIRNEGCGLSILFDCRCHPVNAKRPMEAGDLQANRWTLDSLSLCHTCGTSVLISSGTSTRMSRDNPFPTLQKKKKKKA